VRLLLLFAALVLALTAVPAGSIQRIDSLAGFDDRDRTDREPPNNCAVSCIAVADTPLPDLVGRIWYAEYLPIRGRPGWREVEISAYVMVTNTGNADAPGFAVRFYLVEDTGTYQRRLLIGTRRTGKLPGQANTDFFLTKRLRILESDVCWLEAVIDPGNRIPEADETNNTVRSFLPNGAGY
jgi:hypothetical protein